MKPEELVTLAAEVLANVLQWQVFAYILLGIIVGLTVGVIPGMSGSLGIAVLLPVTLFLPLVESIALLIGVYKASLFGGAISAITFGTPGTPAASADVPDGYSLTKKGKSRKALQIALYSSVTADLGSDVVLLLAVAPLALVVLAFGPAELFALMLFALTMLIMFVENSASRAIVATLIGLFIGSIGSDPITGISRFHFGSFQLRDGIALLPFLIGLFAISEIIVQAVKALNARVLSAALKSNPSVIDAGGGANLTWREYLSCYREILVGWATGTFMGMLPGLGATPAAYTSYALAKRISKDRANFGKGSIQGLAAAEAGNSATSGAAFIPMFAFGIPGSGIAALFMGAFMLQGLTPGPTLIRDNPVPLYSILVMIILANIVFLVVGMVMTPLYARMASIPPGMLVPSLGVLSALGIFATRGSVFDVGVMIATGLLGYGLRLYRFPLPCVLIGYILSHLLESNLRRALLLGQGELAFFFSSPLSVGLYAATVFVVVFFIVAGRSARRAALAANVPEGDA